MPARTIGLALPVNEYGFVTEFHYPYLISYSDYRRIRNRIPSAKRCEIGKCGNQLYSRIFVYDHCHIHDVIRGELCQYHNDFLNAHVINSSHIPWVIQWRNRCPECATQ